MLNERHETRSNFLKKDKNQLEKRLDDVEERLLSTKIAIQSLLACSTQNKMSENEKSFIVDYLIEEKNYLNKRMSEISLQNEEAKIKSIDQNQKSNEIIQRESSIESDFSAKFEAALKESKEKEEIILKLSKKNEKLNKDFKELAKNRLSSSVNPKEIPELLDIKRNAITRVISKIHEYSKFLEGEISTLQKNIEQIYKELWKANFHAKYPFKIGKSLEDFTKPIIYNLIQADIRAKVETHQNDVTTLISVQRNRRKNNKIQSKLEEKFIKIESLCSELKTAEIINQTLKEDRNYLLSSSSYLKNRKGAKQQTYKPGFLDSFCKMHKRVVSNPLDYCSGQSFKIEAIDHGSKADPDLDFSKELNNFSSVEENYYVGPGDSIIDDILDI